MSTEELPAESPEAANTLPAHDELVHLANQDPEALGQYGLAVHELQPGQSYELQLGKDMPVNEDNAVEFTGIIVAGDEGVVMVAEKDWQGLGHDDKKIYLFPTKPIAEGEGMPLIPPVVKVPATDSQVVLGRHQPGAHRLGYAYNHKVSRTHYGVRLNQAGRVKIEDLGSKNHTKIITRVSEMSAEQVPEIILKTQQLGTVALKAGLEELHEDTLTSQEVARFARSLDRRVTELSRKPTLTTAEAKLIREIADLGARCIVYGLENYTLAVSAEQAQKLVLQTDRLASAQGSAASARSKDQVSMRRQEVTKALQAVSDGRLQLNITQRPELRAQVEDLAIAVADALHDAMAALPPNTRFDSYIISNLEVLSKHYLQAGMER